MNALALLIMLEAGHRVALVLGMRPDSDELRIRYLMNIRAIHARDRSVQQSFGQQPETLVEWMAVECDEAIKHIAKSGAEATL